MLGILDVGCIAMHYKQYSQTGCDISPLMKIIQSVTHTYWLVSELDLILEEQGKVSIIQVRYLLVSSQSSRLDNQTVGMILLLWSS